MKRKLIVSREKIIKILYEWAQNEERYKSGKKIISDLIVEEKNLIYIEVFLPNNVEADSNICKEIYEKAPFNGWTEVLSHWRKEGRDNYKYPDRYMGYHYCKIEEDDIMSILADWGYEQCKGATSCTIEINEDRSAEENLFEVIMS